MAASFTLEQEAAALAQALIRADPDVSSGTVMGLGILPRALAAHNAGVARPTDRHWQIVFKMLLAKERADG